MIYCKNCAKNMEDDTLYCPKCGTCTKTDSGAHSNNRNSWIYKNVIAAIVIACVLSLAVGIFAGREIAKWEIRQAIKKAFTDVSFNTDNVFETEQSKPVVESEQDTDISISESTAGNPVELKLNKTVRTKNFEFTARKYELANGIRLKGDNGNEVYYGDPAPSEEVVLALWVDIKNMSGKDIDHDDLVEYVVLSDRGDEYDGFLSGDDDASFNRFVSLSAGGSEQLIFIIFAHAEVRAAEQPLEIRFKMNAGEELEFITA